jgi:hypothetical protein
MEFRKMNLFERKGLIETLKQFCEIDVEDIVCGTNENGALELQNSLEINAPDMMYPNISKVGLTQANDVIIQFYSEDNNQDQHFWGCYPDFNWKEIDENNHNDFHFRH